MEDTQEHRGEFYVLVNDEEQYSLWPAHKSVPNGWRNVKKGDQATCLAFVEEVWTDMRPKSLRERMKNHEHLE